MGERDPGLAPAAPPPPWAERAVLAAALTALLAAVLVLGPVASEPAAGIGVPPLASRLLEAPLAALAGSRAPALLGVLALILAALVGCRSLERRLGGAAPLLVGLLIFGSAGWALVWVEGASLVPLALAVTAFALAFGGGDPDAAPAEIYRPPESWWAGALRWAVVGLLLAELVPGSPLLAALLVPAALAMPRRRRRLGLPVLLSGFALGLAAELVLQGPALIVRPIRVAATTISLDPALIGRNLANLLVGRNVGLLVGFAPLVLLLLLARGAPGRRPLAGVGLALPVLGALLWPFDHAAGWLNLPFLAVYGALWQLPVRRPRRWEWVAVALLSAAAVWPLWMLPRAAVADGGGRLAGAAPRRHLPYEDTLRSLPSRGVAESPRGGLWLRAIEGCRLVDGSNQFELDGGGPAKIWIASPARLEMVGLELGPGAPSSIELSGATAGRTVFRPDGRVGFELLLTEPRGRHRLWSGDRLMAVHLIEVRLPDREGGGPIRFRLLAAPQP